MADVYWDVDLKEGFFDDRAFQYSDENSWEERNIQNTIDYKLQMEQNSYKGKKKQKHITQLEKLDLGKKRCIIFLKTKGIKILNDCLYKAFIIDQGQAWISHPQY